jgi:hypothetical protein
MNRKQPIGWHEECVVNRERTLDELRRHHADTLQRINSMEQDIAWERTRIAEAKRRGLAEYDPERFMMRNGNRVEPKGKV